MVKEYLDARPCINHDITPDSILAIEMAHNARAAELGTEWSLESLLSKSKKAPFSFLPLSLLSPFHFSLVVLALYHGH